MLAALPAVFLQATAPAGPVEARAAGLVALFAGGGAYDTAFDERFRAAVPEPQLRAIAAQLREQLGRPVAVERITPAGPLQAEVLVGFERGTATVSLALEPAAPNRIVGLRITGTALRGDTLDALAAEIRTLPGTAGVGIYALDQTGPRPLLEVNAQAPAPIGSSFKLWVLAEAARQVRAGTRKWSDVVRLGPRSFPSGEMHAWPADAPVTLQTLATLMIDTSDNTATDALLTTLGRARIEALLPALGLAAPARNTPLLTTREVIAIKGDPMLAAAWGRADAAGRRRLLAANAARIADAKLDASVFAGGPRESETVEWFASPADMARTLDWLRRHGDRATQQILAINPGIAPAAARDFAYVGYKGGSEPGVVAMNLLLETRDDRWLAVTGNWHRTGAGVDEARFATLMTRAAMLAQTTGSH